MRWKTLELLGVLTFLNDNFELWQENHLKACIMAIKETNINRDGKAIYKKIYSLIKAMEDYHKDGKRTTACAIMWEEGSKIYDLVKDMYDKTKENRSEENQETSSRTSDGDGNGDVIMRDNDAMTTTNDATTTTNSYTNQLIPQNYDQLIEINKEVRDIYEQISKYQTEINKLNEKANSKLEILKNRTGNHL
ncbi:hypothetical protein RclHR1_29290001 [Rhizophagus clarus]|nr:hypothetical protein RclHR1_29290001 [Rhizophagus clarus]